jgi:hypothetical protein
VSEKLNDKNEIDLIDFFVILIRHRFVLMFIMLASIIIFIGGYFLIPKNNYSKQNTLHYTKAKLSVSMQPFIAQYINQNNENLISINKDDLVVNKYLLNLFTNSNFIIKNIMESGNNHLLLAEGNSADYASLVKDHMINVNLRKPNSITINEAQWVYSVEKKSNSIEIICYFRSLDKIQVDNFLTTMLDNGNKIILGFVKPHVLEHIANYQNYIDIVSIENSADDIYYEYVIALGIIRDQFLPLFVVSDPFIESIQESHTLLELKKSYIRQCLIIIFCEFFILLFFVFIIDYVQMIKNDKERYNKIKNVLRKE